MELWQAIVTAAGLVVVAVITGIVQARVAQKGYEQKRLELADKQEDTRDAIELKRKADEDAALQAQRDQAFAEYRRVITVLTRDNEVLRKLLVDAQNDVEEIRRLRDVAREQHVASRQEWQVAIFDLQLAKKRAESELEATTATLNAARAEVMALGAELDRMKRGEPGD